MPMNLTQKQLQTAIEAIQERVPLAAYAITNGYNLRDAEAIYAQAKAYCKAQTNQIALRVAKGLYALYGNKNMLESMPSNWCVYNRR
jgi:hypothetical protein